MKRQKKAVILICMAFLFVMLASFFYIAKEENHNCTGEDVLYVACIHQAEQNLKKSSEPVLQYAAMPGQKILPVLVAAILCFVVVCRTSLVSQKVRLND